MTKTETSRTVTLESLDGLYDVWQRGRYPLQWDCPFVLPPFLKAWWSAFGEGLAPHICVARQGAEAIGMAPLYIQGSVARFIGDTNVCDYQDFVMSPGRERDFFPILFEHLRLEGVTELVLGHVRGESRTLSFLAGMEESLDCRVLYEKWGTSWEIELPSTWNEFLNMLTGKERHEIRRKLRRLHEAGNITYRKVEEKGAVTEALETFLALFSSNRPDKASFMDHQMSHFFRSLARAMAEVKILNLFFLELDATPVAAVMCFNHNAATYLYNNGYDQRYAPLSVGLLSKVLSIRQSIRSGKKRYDFLKGNEDYKRRLGAESIPLYECRVKLKR
ncbi:MAG: GNAT family N-acetyltransferase [Thermodesulfobacteriota bacterium]|nr:GNAT family N-acetyltransferase [Thermodesulfobacteriota bacterium]